MMDSLVRSLRDDKQHQLPESFELSGSLATLIRVISNYAPISLGRNGNDGSRVLKTIISQK